MVDPMEHPPEPADAPTSNYTFAFRFWAFLILIASIWQFFQPMIISRTGTGTVPAGLHVVSYGLGIIGLVSTAGFWQERKWGLWVFMGLLGVLFLRTIVLAVIEIVNTGTASNPTLRILELFVWPMLLTFLYNQRKYFK